MTVNLQIYLKKTLYAALLVIFILYAGIFVANASPMRLPDIMSKATENFRNERYDSALFMFDKISEMYSEQMSDNDCRIVAEAKLMAGEIHYNRNDYNKALESFMRSVKISEQRELTDCIMNGYKWIGNIYFSFGDYERAITLYETAYSLRNDTTDSKTECDILIDLTGVYCFTRDTAKARKYNILANKLLDRSNPVKRFMADYNDGLIMMIDKDFSGALEKFKLADAEASSPKYRCHALGNIYLCYKGLENPDSAISYMQKCLSLSKQHNIINIYVQTLGDLADFYSSTDPVKADYYKDIHLNISDSIMKSGSNLREFYRLRNIHYLYELEKTDRRISELNMKQELKDSKIKHQKRIQIILTLTVLLFVAFLWIVVRQKKKIRQAYSDLFDINRNMLQEYMSVKEEYNSAIIQCDRYKHQIAEFENMKPDHYAKDNVDADASVEDDVNKGTAAISILDNEKKRTIWSKIEQAMDKDKIYCNSSFSLSRLAEAVGYNQKYVSNVIFDTTGKGFIDFVNDYRIREACARMLDTKSYGNYTIGAIASDVGYKAQSTFIRAFRKNTGLSPSVYQKMALDRDKRVI